MERYSHEPDWAEYAIAATLIALSFGLAIASLWLAAVHDCTWPIRCAL